MVASDSDDVKQEKRPHASPSRAVSRRFDAEEFELTVRSNVAN
jgi:hypothetical protein